MLMKKADHVAWECLAGPAGGLVAVRGLPVTVADWLIP